MKRLILILALMLTAFVGWAQTLGDIQRGWSSKTISNVPSANLGTMLGRFNATWPDYAVKEVLEVIKTGAAKKVIDKDMGRTVIYDAKNGYVEVGDGGDGENMQACVWRRSNGHRLFAVALGKPTDPEIEFCCFYDYDPQRKVLTPEPEILADFLTEHKDSRLYFFLPRTGKELKVMENIYTIHHFEWDDMKPVYSWAEYQLQINTRGGKPTITDFVDAFLSDPDDDGSDCDNWENAWRDYRKGQTKQENVTFTIDERNGYVRIEWKYDEDNVVSFHDFCFWNCADGKRKLLATSSGMLVDGKPAETECTGLVLYSLDKESDILNYIGWGSDALGFSPSEGPVTYLLPRTGKDITFIDSNGKRGTLRWNGNGFSK